MALENLNSMIARLEAMKQAIPEVEAAAVVSLDGLIIASALPENISDDRVSAMSAAILSLAESISNEMGRGCLEQVFTKGCNGYVILTAINDHAVQDLPYGQRTGVHQGALAVDHDGHVAPHQHIAGDHQQDQQPDDDQRLHFRFHTLNSNR